MRSIAETVYIKPSSLSEPREIERKGACVKMKICGLTMKTKTSAIGRIKHGIRPVICLTLALTLGLSPVLPVTAAENETELACAYTPHCHTPDCYDEEEALICGYADFAVHTHDAACLDSTGALVCPLPVITEHRHDETCYELQSSLVCQIPESTGHAHAEACYTPTQGGLICENTDPDHTHTDECFTWENILTCTIPEGEGAHQHTESCYEHNNVLKCDKKEVILHTHTDDCYEDVLDEAGAVIGQKRICGLLQTECHQHGSECLTTPEPTEEPTHETTEAAAPGSTEETGIQSVTALIAALPEAGEIQETLSSLQSSEDPAAYETHLEEITAQIQAAFEAYNALPEAQQEEVENREKLLALTAALAPAKAAPEASPEEIATPTGGFPGYVQDVKVNSIVDGTAWFDETEGDGNDTGENNRIVRTYDTVKYDLVGTLASRDKVSAVKEARLCFAMYMEKGITEARFETDAMTWLQTGYADWQIEYFQGDTLALIQKPDGTLYADLDGDGSFTDKTSINALAGGSEAQRPYMLRDGSITHQRLVGTVTLTNADNILAGTQELYTIITVLNSKNGAILAPRFQAYFEDNPENYGAYTGEDQAKTSEKVTDNYIHLDTYAEGAYQVSITCAPLFNATLRNTTEYLNYLGWFDFSAGDQMKSENLLTYLQVAGRLRENYDKVDPSQYTNSGGDPDTAAAYDALTDSEKGCLPHLRYGRMNGIGITLSIGSSNPEKGYKGCSLPVGTLTFDLSLDVTPEVKESNPDTSGYGAVLWDYHSNVSRKATYQYEDPDHTRVSREDMNKGLMNRNLRWGGKSSATTQGIRVAPASYRGAGVEGKDDDVYDSGYCRLTHIDNSPAAESSAANGKSVYTFTVDQYDFDLDTYWFPYGFLGYVPSNRAQWLSPKGDYSFFGEFGQVLYVFPYTSSGIVNVKRNLAVGNVEVTNASGQTLSLPADAQRGAVISAGNESNPADNEVRDAITLYSPGSFGKRNSFNEASSTYHPTGFLGTNFWLGPNWDESTYAGTDIAILGSAVLSGASDNSIRALNLLQLFDTHALTITPKSGVTGDFLTQKEINFDEHYSITQPADHNPEVTYLFAADPSYPQGYDTNAAGVVSHMNLVRENNLVYADKLYWNEAEQRYSMIKYDINGDGKPEDLTCIGILVELRNCCYNDYGVFRFPVTVTDEKAYVGKTVCTVNIATGWILPDAMKGVTWLNGNWNPSTGTNTLENYETIIPGVNSSDKVPSGIGYIRQNTEKSYEKVEYYEDGSYKAGNAGKAEGATVLILGYKTKVQITDQKSAEAQKPYYSLDSNERTVTWIVNGIGTEVSSSQGTNAESLTDLTIPVKLTYGGKAQTDNLQELFYIPKDHYSTTVPAYNPDGTAKLDADGNPVMITHDIPTDSDHPAQVTFLGSYKDEQGVIQTRLYTYGIYAALGTDGVSVTFHLTDVPVGLSLPGIRFQTNLGSTLLDNDSIKATASISGSADKRAYSELNGNQASADIYISQTATTFLSKHVDKNYGELDTDITYTVSYTNSSDNTIVKSYFYDMLPYTGDIRDSQYTGTRWLTDIQYAVKVAGTDTIVENPQTVATIYGGNSDMASAELRQKLYEFTTLQDTAERNSKIDELLANNFHELKPPVTPADLEGVNGIVVKVENMPGHRDLVITLPMRTSGNQAGDTYLNAAWHWDSGSEALPLQSNIVQTRIISRTISGLVWYDENLNSTRENKELLISGVTVSLFRKDETGSYIPCTQGVTSEGIATGGGNYTKTGIVTTGADGSYHFGELPEGDYVVAFSGDPLSSYLHQTSYQRTGISKSRNSDGVSSLTGVTLKDASGADITANYAYFIRYTPQAPAMPLHSLQDIAAGQVTLNNGVESHPHMDLGLIKNGPKLPKAGGSGMLPLAVTGLTLLFTGAALPLFKRRHTI